MKQLLFLMLGALMSLNTFAQDANDQILGQWTDKDNSRIIEFVKNEQGYDAIIKEVEDASLVGKTQISALEYDKNNAYKNGTLHIYKKNRTAKCSAKLVSATELELSVKVGFRSKTAVWTKIEEEVEAGDSK